MTPAQVIKFFGGVGAAARGLGISQPAVSVWKRKGRIPRLRQLDIEKKTDGKLRAEGEK
jgi:DNA-binding transcriptional regulator YdaS (Cro superfamily)